jgi:hypothetical protein
MMHLYVHAYVCKHVLKCTDAYTAEGLCICMHACTSSIYCNSSCINIHTHMHTHTHTLTLMHFHYSMPIMMVEFTPDFLPLCLCSENHYFLFSYVCALNSTSQVVVFFLSLFVISITYLIVSTITITRSHLSHTLS